MISEQLCQELEKEIVAGQSLAAITTLLRNFRHRGVEREEVLEALDVMRARTADETLEDRILEVMDIVSGFCSREKAVWQ